MAKKKNPVLQKKYEEGREDQRIRDVAIFAVRLQRIEKIKGIGPKRMAMIYAAMEEPFTDEEMEKVMEYDRKLRKGASN